MRTLSVPSMARLGRSSLVALFAFVLSCDAAPVADAPAPLVESQASPASARALAAATGQRASSTVPFGTNGGKVDFVDVVKQSAWDDTSSLDANGWPTTDNSISLIDARHNMPWNGPDPTAINADISGTYRISFTGQAVLVAYTEALEGATIANQAYNAATNTTTADLVVAPGRSFIGLGLNETKRTASSAPGTGFTNLRVIRPGYAPASPPLVTRETLLAYAPPFTAIRFLETDGANEYAAFCGPDGTDLVETTWANRVHVTDAFQGGLPAANAGCDQARGYAWEYMIMLANAGHHDMWINVPVNANNDYVRRLATLIRNGNEVTPGLDPSLHVYVEYSNEVWNPGFPQQQHNQVMAQRGGIAEPERYVERTIEIANIFKSVWGAGSLNNQVRVVALWQYTTQLTMQAALRWAAQRFQVRINQVLWGIGQAPYYDPTDTSSVDNIFDTLWTGSDKRRTDLIGWQAVASYFGIKEVGYESGPSLSAYPMYVTGIPAADRDPRIIPGFIHHYLDNWYAVGGDLVNFYSMRGKVSPFGDWFLVEDDNVISRFDQPKFAAALAVMSASPPAISVGHVLPWTPNGSSDLDPSQFVPAPFAETKAPGSGLTVAPLGTGDPAFNTYDYLLRTTGSGSYAITFNGHSDAAGAELKVYVDDALRGTVTLPQGSDALSAPVNVTLAPGFHTLWLVGGGTAKTVFPPGTGAIRIRSTGARGAAVVPSAPHNLSAATVDSQRIALTWATTTMATGYVVKRSTQSGGPYAVVGRPTANSFTDTGLREGRTYYYVVAATNAVGESAVSPQVPAVPTAAAAPAAPAGLTVVRSDATFDLSQGGDGFLAGGEILLSWRGVPGATSYTIIRTPCMTGVDEAACPIATQLANVTSYIDIGAVFFPPDPQVGVGYTYTVQANNAFGSSADSNAVSATPVVHVPDAPTRLDASKRGGVVFLDWTPPFGMLPMFDPAQYNVYRATSPDGPFVLLAPISTATFVDRAVVAGTTYYYVVTAVKPGVGEGPRSNRVRVSL